MVVSIACLDRTPERKTSYNFHAFKALPFHEIRDNWPMGKQSWKLRKTDQLEDAENL